jgi:predicted small secreted protein
MSKETITVTATVAAGAIATAACHLIRIHGSEITGAM